MDACVLYEDGHLLAAYKPRGVLSEADEKQPNMPALLRELTGADVLPVHRLDRTTEGLMVYAKTAEAAKRLGVMIQKGEFEKTYLAVAEGKPAGPAGELVDLLYFDHRKNKSYVVRRERRGVKRAVLRYETLDTVSEDGQELSLLKIRLLTGRTHQIRVQLASRKMPLAGDRRYGSRVGGDVMLCSSELRFTHPFTGEKLHFSHMPTDGLFRLFKA